MFYRFRILLILVLICFLLLPACGAGNNSESSFNIAAFSVIADDTFGTDILIDWYYNITDGKHYIFTPAWTDLNHLTLRFAADDDVYVDGKQIFSDKPTDVFCTEDEYCISCGDRTYPLVVMQSKNVGTIFITTESGNMDSVNADKEHKESGTITVINKDGGIDYSGSLDYIKGRGNHTWTEFEKKSYNLKLGSESSLLGMQKATKWCLIANAQKDRLIRNHIVYDWAKNIGLSSSPDNEYCDFYINGKYCGNYLLTEKVEVGKGRVEITDLEKENEKANSDADIHTLPSAGNREENAGYANGTVRYIDIPNEPETIDGGYILEVDLPERYEEEPCGFVTDYGTSIVVKSPKYASRAEIEYISSFYSDFEEALLSPDGFNSNGIYYDEYIDAESFAKVFIINELTKNGDAGKTSFFMYKDSNGRLTAGPVWDFDNGFYPDTDGIASGELIHFRLNRPYSGSMTPLSALWNHDDFRKTVSEIWHNSVRDTISDFSDSALTEYSKVEESAVMDALRWNKFETSDADTIKTTLRTEAERTSSFITTQGERLDSFFVTDGYGVHYYPNGGSELVLDTSTYSNGEVAVIKENAFVNGDCQFVCWNTEPDGTGTDYYPNDRVAMTGMLTLFAKWESSKSK